MGVSWAVSRIRIQVLPPIARPGERVVATGGIPALGDWDPSRGLVLRWSPPFHTGEFEAETGAHVEYKITRGSWETEAVDAYGDVPGNFVHETWLDATRRHTVADWKDRYRGRLTRETIYSRALAGSRDLLIWLPPGYSTDGTRRHPVIVLHDGANVFDPETAFGGVDWAADEWVIHLSGQGVLAESIVVGICHPEGFPGHSDASFRDSDLSPELAGAAYAQFVVADVIPHMDSRYRTNATPSARVLGGAGLGALLTFYVALHHPGVFGNFACLSGNFGDVSQSRDSQVGELRALAATPALGSGVRMYFDYDGDYDGQDNEAHHLELARLLGAQGWTREREFTIRKLAEARHDELSWRQRLGDALRFLAQ